MVIAWFLNGPGYAFSLFPVPSFTVFGCRIFEAGRLIGVAIMWFVIGLSFDRKLRGEKVINARWLQWVLYLAGFVLCILMAWAALSHLRFQSEVPWNPFFFRLLRRDKLWTPGLTVYAILVWAAFGIVYYGRKLWVTFRIRPSRDPKQQILTT
jgi:hypothetical protein